jgi:hypothetical protein
MSVKANHAKVEVLKNGDIKRQGIKQWRHASNDNTSSQAQFITPPKQMICTIEPLEESKLSWWLALRSAMSFTHCIAGILVARRLLGMGNSLSTVPDHDIGDSGDYQD